MNVGDRAANGAPMGGFAVEYEGGASEEGARRQLDESLDGGQGGGQGVGEGGAQALVGKAPNWCMLGWPLWCGEACSGAGQLHGTAHPPASPSFPPSAYPTHATAALFDRRFTATDHSKEEKLFDIVSREVTKSFGTALAGGRAGPGRACLGAWRSMAQHGKA